MKTLQALIGLTLVPVLLPLVACTVLFQAPESHAFRRGFFAAVKHDWNRVVRSLFFGDLGTGIVMCGLSGLGIANLSAHNQLAGLSCIITSTVISLR